MFSLKFRSELPAAVKKELDQLVAGLKAFLLVSHDEEGNLTVAASAAAGTSDGVPAGVIHQYGGATVPAGYLLCDGSAVNRNTYALLFAAISTLHGVGDGLTTFNVPDMRQRFPIGKAAAGTGSVLGGTGGLIDHTHTGPSHTHTVTTTVPSATVAVQAGVGTTVATDTHTHQGPTDAAGAGNTGTANPPFLALNYIIRTGL